MHLCVIGNSHVAALKGGLADIEASEPSLRVTFFASRGQTLGGLEVAQGCLVPSRHRLAQNLAFTSGGQSEIDPDEFDGFVLCGLGLGLRYELLGPRFYSRQFACEYTWASWRASVCMHVHGLLRSLTDKPVLVCPEPFLSESSERWSRLARSSATPPAHLAAAFTDAHALWAGDSQVLCQPAESVVSHIFSAARFSAGSIKLAIHEAPGEIEHAARDAAHMNAAYGALVWQAIAHHWAGRAVSSRLAAPA